MFSIASSSNSFYNLHSLRFKWLRSNISCVMSILLLRSTSFIENTLDTMWEPCMLSHQRFTRLGIGITQCSVITKQKARAQWRGNGKSSLRYVLLSILLSAWDMIALIDCRDWMQCTIQPKTNHSLRQASNLCKHNPCQQVFSSPGFLLASNG